MQIACRPTALYSTSSTKVCNYLIDNFLQLSQNGFKNLVQTVRHRIVRIRAVFFDCYDKHGTNSFEKDRSL